MNALNTKQLGKLYILLLFIVSCLIISCDKNKGHLGTSETLTRIYKIECLLNNDLIKSRIYEFDSNFISGWSDIDKDGVQSYEVDFSEGTISCYSKEDNRLITQLSFDEQGQLGIIWHDQNTMKLSFNETGIDSLYLTKEDAYYKYITYNDDIIVKYYRKNNQDDFIEEHNFYMVLNNDKILNLAISPRVNLSDRNDYYRNFNYTGNNLTLYNYINTRDSVEYNIELQHDLDIISRSVTTLTGDTLTYKYYFEDERINDVNFFFYYYGATASVYDLGYLSALENQKNNFLIMCNFTQNSQLSFMNPLGY